MQESLSLLSAAAVDLFDEIGEAGSCIHEALASNWLGGLLVGVSGILVLGEAWVDDALGRGKAFRRPAGEVSVDRAGGHGIVFGEIGRLSSVVVPQVVAHRQVRVARVQEVD